MALEIVTMVDNLTPRATKAIALATQVAYMCGRSEVDGLHLLLGLLREGTGVGSSVLKQFRVSYRRVRDRCAMGSSSMPKGAEHHELPLSADGQKVVDCAIRQSVALGHNYVGTEHILLGLADVDGSASRMLAELRCDVLGVHRAVVSMVDGPPKGILLDPRPVEKHVRKAVWLCWQRLPRSGQNLQDVSVVISRMVERAVRDLTM